MDTGEFIILYLCVCVFFKVLEVINTEKINKCDFYFLLYQYSYNGQ